MQEYQIRTDLALEATESVRKNASEDIRGINIEEYDVLDGVHVTKVEIASKNASKSLRKPMGKYFTLEAPELQEYDDDFHAQISKEISLLLKSILPDNDEEDSVLVVGLGNRDVTADALGPFTVDNLYITRHIIKEYGKDAYHNSKIRQISALIPGVMAKTGMETVEIIKGVISETKPDVIIIIDALAARSVKRLNRTVQITDTGIHPGSGVGNYRQALTDENLGVPVIAIGIPMVVDAGTIVCDALEKVSKEYDGAKESLNFIRNNSNLQLNNMYVTTKNIDETTKRLSFTLSEAINMALEI